MIQEVNLLNISIFKGKKYIPVFFRIKNEAFNLIYNKKSVDISWIFFMKIFFYKFSEANSDVLKQFFDVRMFSNDKNKGEVVFSESGRKLYFNHPNQRDNIVKFFNNSYMMSYSSCYNNLLIVKKVTKNTTFNDFKIYVCLKEDVYKKEFFDKLELLKKNMQKKIKIKNANFVSGYINRIIFNNDEKITNYIDYEFKKRKLIGEISLNNEQNCFITNYMKEELHRLKLCPDNFYPYEDKIFAVGLVLYAKKYYNKKHNGEFWPYFKNEYDIKFDGSEQRIINNVFEKTMKKYNKIYFDNTTSKIDNITMHSFVADNSADQLLDFLYDFYRLDLCRNIENLYTNEGTESFNFLIESMENGVANVMSHTSLLLQFKEIKGIYRSKIKRILRLIDSSFWNDDYKINDNGNRINHLMNLWLNNSHSHFQKDKKFVKKSFLNKKGEILYHQPTFSIKFSFNKLKIILPQQRLINFTQDDFPEWKIKSNGNFETILDVEYFKDSIGFYTNKMEIEIPFKELLNRFEFELLNGDKIINKYVIEEDCIRFFDLNGHFIDYKKKILPEGQIISFSSSNEYPYIDTNFDSQIAEPFFVKSMNLFKGQIIILENNYGIQVGQKISEGYNEVMPVSGVKLKYETAFYNVYNKLPKLIFQANSNQLKGASLSINGKQNKIEKYKEIKLIDNVNTLFYLIDLNDYINDEGLYDIFLNYPRQNYNKVFESIAYLKNFNYKFVNAPYIFKTVGTLEIPSLSFVKPDIDDGVLEINEKIMRFTFNFAEKNINDSNYCKLIENEKLKLKYKLNNLIYDIYFEIPAFFWKYSENDQWNVQAPSNIFLKNLKSKINKLYVKGPFNFYNSFISLPDDVEIADEESEIKFKGGIYQFYDISNLYYWLKNNVDSIYKEVYININNSKFKLFDVVCKSKINNVSLVADFEKNKIIGKVDIEGNETYYANLLYENNVIGEEIPIINNEFSYECELKEGTYKVFIYEIIDNDEDNFGFNNESILLNKNPFLKQLINLNQLENCKIKIYGFHDKENKLIPIKLGKKYYLLNLEKTSYKDFIKEYNDPEIIYGIWSNNIDINNFEQMDNFIYYYADLCFLYNDGTPYPSMKVLIVFTEKNNPNSIIILTKDFEENYASLEIDLIKRKFLTYKGYKNYSSLEKKNCFLFYDDEYVYDIEIMEKNQ